MSVLKDYAPFSGPSDRFSYDLVMDGPEKGKCRSIISISLINWNLSISTSISSTNHRIHGQEHESTDKWEDVYICALNQRNA